MSEERHEGDTEVRTCTACGERVEHVPEIGWVEVEIGGHYDQCPERYDPQTDTPHAHVVADSTVETWLLFDQPGDEEASHEANITPTPDECYRVTWYHTAVGVVSARVFLTRDDAQAFLAAGGYENYTS